MEFADELKEELFKVFPELEVEYNSDEDLQRNFIKFCYALKNLKLKKVSPFLESEFTFLRKRFGILPTSAKIYAVVGRELGYSEKQTYIEKRLIFEKIKHIVLYGIYVPDEYIEYQRSKNYQEYVELDNKLKKVFYKLYSDYINGIDTSLEQNEFDEVSVRSR